MPTIALAQGPDAEQCTTVWKLQPAAGSCNSNIMCANPFEMAQHVSIASPLKFKFLRQRISCWLWFTHLSIIHILYVVYLYSCKFKKSIWLPKLLSAAHWSKICKKWLVPWKLGKKRILWQLKFSFIYRILTWSLKHCVDLGIKRMIHQFF